MAKFIIHTYPGSKKLKPAYTWFWSVFAALCLASLFFINRGDNMAFLRVISFSFLFWSGMDWLRKKKRGHFIELTDELIKWLLSEEENTTVVYWNDIRWIKKEQDGGITLFLESSFSRHFLLTEFLDDDREKILQLLRQTANTRQISLINFSETIPEVA